MKQFVPHIRERPAARRGVAYQVWKAELPGFWRPLAQFEALQFLVAYGIERTAP
jgi:hypothetical protein